MAIRIRSAGILKELDRQDEVKRLDQKRMDEREQLYLSLASKYGPGTLANRASGKGGTTDSLAITIQALQRDYKLSDDLLAPVIASGDAPGARKLLETLNKAKAKFVGDNRTFPETVVEEIVAGIITSEPTNKPLDMDKITKLIGRDIDPMYLPILESMNTTPGEVYVPEYTYAEPVSFEELDKSIKSLTTSQTFIAKQEKYILQKELNILKGISNQTDAQKNAFGLISQRLVTLDNALDTVKDNPAEIIGLYGNSFYNKMLETPYGERIKAQLPIPGILAGSEYEYPQVATVQIANIMLDAEIFKPGDKVRIAELNNAVKTLGYKD